MKKRIPNPYSPEEVRQAFAQTNRDLGDNYLPYVGAEQDLEMGSHSISTTDIAISGGITTVDYIQFDLNHTCDHIEGRLHWNSEDGVLEHGLPGGNNCMQAGQTLLRCRNNSGATILDGKVVCACGAHVGKPTISLADITSHPTTFSFGITLEDIANNSFGYVIMSGLARNIDTSTVAEGTLAYLSDITPGEITSSLPSHPNGILSVGMVMRSHANEGIIFCDPTFIPYMFTLPDVKHVVPSVDGEFYRYVAANSRFELANDSSVDHGVLIGLADDDHTQYVLYTGAHTDVDLGTHNLTTTGQVNAINVGTRTNGSAYLGLSTGDGPLSCVYVGSSAGENNTGQGGVFVGDYAGKNCEDEFAIMVGNSAGRDSNGTAPVLVGLKAGQEQEGESVIILGNNAGFRNKAGTVVIAGYLAGQDNYGGASIILGYRAGENNAGGWANIAGYYSGECSTSPYANLFGYRAGQFTEGWGTIAIGYEANGAFISNTAGNKNFNSSVVDVDTDRITIPTHGFASIGTYFNLLYTEGSAPITGLSDGQVYQFKVIDADTIEGHGTQILVAGSGISHTFTPQYRYDNTICIGYQTSPTKSNQMILGGSDISETLIRGTVLLDSDNQAIAFGSDGETDSYAKFNGTDLVLYSSGDIDFSGCSLVNVDIDHGGLTGLADDDHSQYHNDTRGDARYFQQSEFVNASAGAGDAGKPVTLDAAGHVDASMINDADVDHGLLGGLGDDDHSQYHNDTRGDARYYTQTLLDAGQLDTRYFTESEHVNSSAGGGDAGKPIVLDAGGLIDSTMLDDELIPASTANSQIYQSTGVGTAAWTTDITGLTSLVVDNLTIDGATIQSDDTHVYLKDRLRVGADGYNESISSVGGTVTAAAATYGQSVIVSAESTAASVFGSYVNLTAKPATGEICASFWGVQTVDTDTALNPLWAVQVGAGSIEKSGTGTIDSVAAFYAGAQTVGTANYGLYCHNAIAIVADNEGLLLGDDINASFCYDGTDAVINPKLVGTGKLKVLGDVHSSGTVEAATAMTIDDDYVPRVLDANLTIYVRTTGSDSNGGASSGDAFLTVARAYGELYRYIPGGKVISIDIGEGEFPENNLVLEHHSGSGFVFSGVYDADTNCSISNITGITVDGTLSYFDMDITLSVGETSAVGQYVLVRTMAATGTKPELCIGCHEVTAWNSGTRVATIRVYGDSGNADVPSGALTATVLTVIKTVLSFASSDGISIDGCYHGGTWNGLILRGVSNKKGIYLQNGGVLMLGSNFGTSLWHQNISLNTNSVCFARYSAHSRAYYILAAASTGSVFDGSYAIFSGSASYGLYCASGSSYTANSSWVILTGSTYAVYCATASFMGAVYMNVFYGNSTIGIYAFRGGFIDASGSVITGFITGTSSDAYSTVIV